MRAKLVYLIVLSFLGITSIAQTTENTIKHTVEPGQTLYFISKKYNVSVDELRKSNPAIADDLIIKPEQVLTIPVKNVPVKQEINRFQVHTVKTKETLYSISKEYGVTVNDLIQLNNLENANISIGQTLRIKPLTDKVEKEIAVEEVKNTVNSDKKPEKPIKEVKEVVKEKEVAKPSFENEVLNSEDASLYKQLFESYGKGNNTLMKDKGIGNYLESNNSNVYLMMASNVPTGQIAKVRNLMNNKVIYLKVVGPISAKDADNNISIKISKAAAKDLNIIEDRFLAEWTWYKLGESQPNTKKTVEPFDDF